MRFTKVFHCVVSVRNSTKRKVTFLVPQYFLHAILCINARHLHCYFIHYTIALERASFV